VSWKSLRGAAQRAQPTGGRSPSVEPLDSCLCQGYGDTQHLRQHQHIAAAQRAQPTGGRSPSVEPLDSWLGFFILLCAPACLSAAPRRAQLGRGKYQVKAGRAPPSSLAARPAATSNVAMDGAANELLGPKGRRATAHAHPLPPSAGANAARGPRGPSATRFICIVSARARRVGKNLGRGDINWANDNRPA
jgi:hypothetical protein